MEQSINQRIRKLINVLGVSDNQFAKNIGIAQSAISSMFSRNTEPSSKVISAILTAYAEVSAEWLIMGNGNMTKDNIEDCSISKEPEVIYHYTDVKGIFGIIGNLGFRFSPIVNSNDLREKFNDSGYKSVCFCMAGKYDNGYDKPRMWSQYGDENKGFCIGVNLERLISLNNGEGCPSIENFKVKYLNPTEIVGTKNDTKESLECKAKDWENENEYRFISKEADFLKIDFDCIESIYSGELTEDEEGRLANIGLNGKIIPYIERKGSEIHVPLYNKHHQYIRETEDFSLDGFNGKIIRISSKENIPENEGIKNALSYYEEICKKEEANHIRIIETESEYLAAKEKGLTIIPEIDFKVSAGIKETIGSDKVIKYWYLPYCKDCDIVVQVTGNSMSPTYPSGSWVALKRYSIPENPNSIPFGNVFGIVVMDESTGETHAYIKVLRRYKDEEMAKKYWVAHSINTDEYDDFDIKIGDVVSLWVVKQHIVSDMF